MALCSLLLSILFLSSAFSSLAQEEPGDEPTVNEEESLASFFDFWMPRMRMRGRRSVDAKASNLKQGKASSEKRFWNANQKDMMSYLDAFKQRSAEKRFWNANQKDMMSYFDAFKQGNDGKYKRFWNANQKDMMSYFDAFKQGNSESG